jgi:hypothetical protein
MQLGIKQLFDQLWREAECLLFGTPKMLGAILMSWRNEDSPMRS